MLKIAPKIDKEHFRKGTLQKRNAEITDKV